MSKKQKRKCVSRPATLTIPELEQYKAAVLRDGRALGLEIQILP
jgi:hypothetical protein